jgi:hypothetical protein
VGEFSKKIHTVDPLEALIDISVPDGIDFAKDGLKKIPPLHLLTVPTPFRT